MSVHGIRQHKVATDLSRHESAGQAWRRAMGLCVPCNDLSRPRRLAERSGEAAERGLRVLRFGPALSHRLAASSATTTLVRGATLTILA